MAAVGKVTFMEDKTRTEASACNLITVAKDFLPSRRSQAHNKENAAKDTGDLPRHTGDPSPGPCDLVREADSLQFVPDDGLKETKCPDMQHWPLAREIEALHATLKQKDVLIASLQSQLLSVCQSRSSREAERVAREREKALLLERAARLQQQVDRRRAHVKNARLALEQIDATERSIDDCIRRAELEYHLETEELAILNLQGEHMRLTRRLDGAADGDGLQQPSVSLSSCLPSHAEMSLHYLTVPHDPDSPCFSVTETATESGVLVSWASDICGLVVGDRLLEVNGRPALGSSGPALVRLLADSASPLQLLVVRCRPPRLGHPTGPTGPADAAAAAALQQELAQLAGRLQQKTSHNKVLHAEKQRCVAETAAYRAENERLLRRLRQLEFRVQQMQGVLDKIRGVTDEGLSSDRWDDEGDRRSSDGHPSVSRVPDGASDHELSPLFARGPHTATIPVNGPGELRAASVSPAASSRSPSPAPTCPAAPSVTAPGRRQAALAAMSAAETPAARQPRPRPRSLLQRLQLFGERRLQGAACTLQRPRPPQKPARLSLQRAVSLQSLQQPQQEPTKPTQRPPRPVVQTWPSVDGNLEMVRHRARGLRVRHQMCSLPRPARPAATQPVLI